MNLFIITYILIIKRNIWSYSSKILKTLVQSSVPQLRHSVYQLMFVPKQTGGLMRRRVVTMVLILDGSSEFTTHLRHYRQMKQILQPVSVHMGASELPFVISTMVVSEPGA